MFALLALAIVPAQLPADGWVAFDQPAVAGTERMGCDSDGKASLAGDDDHWNISDDDAGGHHDRFTVFIEMRGGEPRRLRAYTPDCDVNGAEGAERIEIDAVDAVALLSGYLGLPRSRELKSGVIVALAHINEAAAGKALAAIADDTRDEDRSHDALFWLAQRRGDYGRRIVVSHLDEAWPLQHREHAVMSLALSGHADALAAVRDAARGAQPAELRAQAVLALGITNAPGALADLHSIFLVDHDPRVREQAIFALAQLEHPAAAETLADIIREPRNGEHRRTALFWLSQMDDEDSQNVIDGLLQEVF